jgi:hypothetical protein
MMLLEGGAASASAPTASPAASPPPSAAASSSSISYTSVSVTMTRECLTIEEHIAAATLAMPADVAAAFHAMNTTTSAFDLVFGHQHTYVEDAEPVAPVGASAIASAAPASAASAASALPGSSASASSTAPAASAAAPPPPPAFKPGFIQRPSAEPRSRSELRADAHGFTHETLTASRVCLGGMSPLETPLACLRNQLYINAVCCGPSIPLDMTSAPYPLADQALLGLTADAHNESFLRVSRHGQSRRGS